MRVSFAIVLAALLISASAFGQSEYLAKGEGAVFVGGSAAVMEGAEAFGATVGWARSIVQASFSYSTSSGDRNEDATLGGVDLAIFGRILKAAPQIKGFVSGGLNILNSERSTGATYLRTVSLGCFVSPGKGDRGLQLLLMGTMISPGTDLTGSGASAQSAIAAGVEFAPRFTDGLVPLSFSVVRNTSQNETTVGISIGWIILYH